MSLSDQNRALIDALLALTDHDWDMLRAHRPKLLERLRRALRAEGRPSPEDAALFSRCYEAMARAISVIDVDEGPGRLHSEILNLLAAARVDIERRSATISALSTPSPEPVCGTCNGRGEIGGWFGQTAESGGWETEPCQAGREEARSRSLASPELEAIRARLGESISRVDANCDAYATDPEASKSEAMVMVSMADARRLLALSPPAPEPGYEAEPVAYIRPSDLAELGRISELAQWVFGRPDEVYSQPLYASPVPVSREEISRTIYDFLEERFPGGCLPGGVQLFADDELDADFKHEAGCDALADAILQRLSNQQGEGKGSLPESPSGVRPSDDTDPQSQHSDGGQC
jgi:hypothetical protein